MGSSDWLNKLNALGAKPAYQSQYQGAIDNLLNTISNRKEFSYDFKKDPLYQNYKDIYTKLGNEASMNAVANASNMTGGYGNSYAVTAGAQANQQYLTQLNSMIPQLAQAAMDKYQMETQNLYNQYSMYGDAEDRNYGQYRDRVSDYYTDRDYYTTGYNNERNLEYQQERDRVSDAQWQKNYDYNAAMDAISNAQWKQNFDYNAARDAISDAQWQQSFDESKRQYDQNYALSKAKASGSTGSETGSSLASGSSMATKTDLSKYIANAKSLTHAATSSQNPAKQYAESLYNKGKISAEQYKQILSAIN